METERIIDKINNAPPEVQANPVQRINREGVVEQAEVTYMECRRNYAASTGGYIIDGCGKFLKGGQDDTKEALLCTTCGCHRSFHRKVLPPPHLRDSRYNIMNYLCSLPITTLQARPPTPWLMRSPTLPNYELIEGQGSSSNPDETKEKPESESGGEINQPSDINKAG
ncbi:hypothetical protein CRYUN_Cryun06bG0011100 [Craigia yunnanensis]